MEIPVVSIEQFHFGIQLIPMNGVGRYSADFPLVAHLHFLLVEIDWNSLPVLCHSFCKFVAITGHN